MDKFFAMFEELIDKIYSIIQKIMGIFEENKEGADA